MERFKTQRLFVIFAFGAGRLADNLVEMDARLAVATEVVHTRLNVDVSEVGERLDTEVIAMSAMAATTRAELDAALLGEVAQRRDALQAMETQLARSVSQADERMAVATRGGIPEFGGQVGNSF